MGRKIIRRRVGSLLGLQSQPELKVGVVSPQPPRRPRRLKSYATHWFPGQKEIAKFHGCYKVLLHKIFLRDSPLKDTCRAGNRKVF